MKFSTDTDIPASEGVSLSLGEDAVSRAVLVPVSYEELPDAAVKRFELYAARFLHPDDYRPGNFSKILKTVYDGSELYVALQIKNDQSMAYLYGEKDGETEFWGEIGDHLKVEWDSSYLYFIGVAEKFRRTGVAGKKIGVFDAVSRFAFGKPLRSWTNFTSAWDEEKGMGAYPMRNVFEKLSQAGVVVPYEGDAENKGYVFSRKVLEILEPSPLGD